MTKLSTQNPIHLVQITDTHLYSGLADTLLKMNTQDSLNQVIDLVNTKESIIDLILATGDIAQDASAAAYNNFSKSISKLDAPYRWIPGNHDNIAVMELIPAANDANERVITINNWLILMLDTSILGQVHGRLADKELQLIDKTLSAAQNDAEIEHCLVSLHHNPVSGSAVWMQDIGLENSEEFFVRVTQCDKVRAIVYGHIHQELDFMHGQHRCFCTPSTCIQFKPNVNNFALDQINPGYRNFKLFEDGRIESKVYRVTGSNFEVDYSSSGY
jgi:Icc protein